MSKDITDIPDKLKTFIFNELPDKIEKHKHPLILTIVFLSIYFIVEIPEHWEIGFHMFYFILMSSFLGYICFCFNDNKQGKGTQYIDVLTLFSFLFFGLYFLFNTFMRMSGGNQNTFLKSTLYIGIGFIIFLLFKFRVPNNVSIKKYKETKETKKNEQAQEEAQPEAQEQARPEAQPEAQEERNPEVQANNDKKRGRVRSATSYDSSSGVMRKRQKTFVGGSGAQETDKGKSYFISIITEPFYILKDAFEILLCIFDDNTKWNTIKELLQQYFTYHSPAFLLLGISSLFLYTWINYSPSSKPGVLIDTNAKSLDIEHVVAKSKDLYPKGNRDYSFSLRGRIFIEQPVDMIDKEYNLIDYGDVPRMTYNPKRHIIYVYMKKGRKEIRVHEIDEIKYQKWNHFVFNYSHGTMDIFWNTSLIASIHELIPYMTMDSIVVGEHQGIRGGVKDLQFRHEPLSMFNIYSSYYFM